MKSTRRIATLALAVVTIVFADRGATAGSVTPQALAASLRKDPAFMPSAPGFTSYRRGIEKPPSTSETKAGVIAKFEVIFDYLVADPTTGITYRVFRDQSSARAYYDSMSVNREPGFIAPVLSSTYNVQKPETQGFKTFTCETFVDPRDGWKLTARCAALCETTPVIVSGVRIQQTPVTHENGMTNQTVSANDQNTVRGIAIALIWGGMLRITSEYALLDGLASFPH